MPLSDDDIKEALGKIPKEEYPKDLQTATKAEYTTMAKQYKKDKEPGCPFMLFILILKVLVIAAMFYVAFGM